MADSSGTTGETPVNLGTIERAVSIGLGAALLARLLGRTVIVPALLGLGATALIWRGINGICPVKAGLSGDTGRGGGDGRMSRRSGSGGRHFTAETDVVNRASQDSFPASDPPAWSSTNGPSRRH